MSGIILNAANLNCDAIEIDKQTCGNTNTNTTTITNPNLNSNLGNPVIEEDENNLNSNRQRSPTTNSIDSNNISIVTLDENEDSSTIDSDSDAEEIVNRCDNHYTTSSGIVLATKNLDPPNLFQSSVLSANDAKPNIGSIAVQNSSDITFGNKTFYQGPVTIKQIVRHDKNKNDDKDHPDELKKKRKFIRKQTLTSAIIAAALICSLLTLILVVKFNKNDNNDSSSSSKESVGDGDDQRKNIPIASSIADDLISDSAGPLRVITRKEWIAQPPEGVLDKLELPSTRVIIAHTVTSNCSTQADCTFQVRTIQTYHIESRGWDDIAYNFLVGGDGAVYEGRGWNNQGAHTKGYNRKSICIAFIGTFNKIAPPKRQIWAAQKMLEEGVKLKKLIPDYKLYGHRQLMATESPGLTLYEIIKKWDHWSDKIDSA